MGETPMLPKDAPESVTRPPEDPTGCGRLITRKLFKIVESHPSIDAVHLWQLPANSAGALMTTHPRAQIMEQHI
jgi:hypothetical protein